MRPLNFIFHCLIVWLLFCGVNLEAQISRILATGSRSLATVYQNNSGELLFISVIANDTCAGGGCTLVNTQSALVGSANPPTQVVNKTSLTIAVGGQEASVANTLYAIVPPSYFYEVTDSSSGGGTVSIGQWTEWAFSNINSGSQSVVTGSRSFGTAFQNTTTGLLWIEVTGTPSGGGATITTYSGITDSSASPTTTVAEEGNASGSSGSILFPVLPNNFYKVTQNNGSSLDNWVEVSSSIPNNVTQNVVTSSRHTGFQDAGCCFQTFQPLFVTSSVTSNTGGPGTAQAWNSNNFFAQDVTASRTKLASETALIIQAVPFDWVYAAPSDQMSPSLQVWTEWDIPASGGCNGGLCSGEPHRRTPH